MILSIGNVLIICGLGYNLLNLVALQIHTYTIIDLNLEKI